MNKLILASNSPRRKELLSILGYPFEVIPSNISEDIDKEKSITNQIEELSYNKAFSVFNNNKDAIVIGADTIVYFDNKIYGKPKNIIEAKHMLQELRNNTHKVVTGVTIISNKQSECFSSITDVTFGDISDDEIDQYIKKENVLDKAGAYAIQGYAKKYIKEIHGDFYTVVGLPIYELGKRLKKYYE